jgi:hypothetical protein
MKTKNYIVEKSNGDVIRVEGVSEVKFDDNSNIIFLNSEKQVIAFYKDIQFKIDEEGGKLPTSQFSKSEMLLS